MTADAGHLSANHNADRAMTCEHDCCARRIAELEEQIEDLESELFYLSIAGSDE